MKVLSLFDGMSCGQLALNKIGIKPREYYASEIDKNAIKVTQANFPDTIQLGDITKWKEWNIDWKGFDLICAGFPCQAWSKAGGKLGTDDPRGALVFTLIEIYNHIKTLNPNCVFLFENVKMKNEHLAFINDLFETEPHQFNSLAVSAQNRLRMYWTNIPNVMPPKDRNILISDITEPDSGGKFLDQDKANRILQLASMDHKSRKKHHKEKLCTGHVKITIPPGKYIYTSHLGQNGGIVRDKAATMTTANSMAVTEIKDGILGIRKLTPIECEKLQNVPKNYTNLVCDSARFHMLGNGWTVDMIAHILSYLKK
jgi:DNA-cytosine methyltransferase